MGRFLRHIHAIRYGGLVDREVGPFGPGLNIVYGPNEAGKSTLASLVGGVLFGWESESAHGVRNTYRPAEGGRAGALTWEDRETETASRLARDEDAVTGDLSVTGDIDRATFDTIFSLTADELRSLRNSSDLTARLLTAGSGTASSPSAAFIEVERRIANTPIYMLENELEDAQERVKQATEQVKLYLQEDRELRELEASRATTAERIAALDDELEDLIARRAELEAADARAAQLAQELDALRADRGELDARLFPARNGGDFSLTLGMTDVGNAPAVADAAGAAGAAEVGAAVGSAASHTQESGIDRRLLGLDSAGDRVLRDRIDELGEEREKLVRGLDLAKENSSTSTAAYEALCELDDEEVAASRRLRNRPSQAIVSVLLPIAFICAGIPLFMHGREISSLSFTALGVGLVVVAIFLAVAAFFVLFRQPAATEGLERRRTDAQWVMLQDRKKLDARLAEQAEFEARVAEFLEGAGLAAAEGSLRQARSLLDEARDLRAARAEDEQRASALDLRIHAAEQELAALDATRARLAAPVGVAGTTVSRRGEAMPRPSTMVEAEAWPRSYEGGVPVEGSDSAAARLGALVRERTGQRDALLEASEDMSRRIGELTRELEHARGDRTLDQAKFEYQQLRVRLREAKHELISLLLAKRMLERSIATWESQAQPEVHARAGRLLATITGGRWVQVATSPTGSLVAIDADGTARDPRHLSLGTCQQLYLALRIALLITADDVGRAIPVLADDILVNFDGARRRGAAAALAELAAHRQVIVLTCHEATAAVLKEAAPQAVRIDL